MHEYSIPALAEIAAGANLAKVIFRRAAEQPQAVMLRRPGPDGPQGPSGSGGRYGTWEAVTASQFRDEVVAVAKGLIAAGIEAGDRVAVMSQTRYEWTLIDYAIWTAGAVSVPVYETSSAEQAEWILQRFGRPGLFRRVGVLRAALRQVPRPGAGPGADLADRAEHGPGGGITGFADRGRGRGGG